jgi:hypothetical protein
MAFCNSCGATLTPGTKFCNQCGATIAGAPETSATPAAASAPPPASAYTPTRSASSVGGNNALKTLLIVLGVVVALGILGLFALGAIARHYLAKNFHVSQNGDHVRVEIPFGSTETSKDPGQVIRDLGVDIYPGAQVENNGATTLPSAASTRSLRVSIPATRSTKSVPSINRNFRTPWRRPPAEIIARSSQMTIKI